MAGAQHVMGRSLGMRVIARRVRTWRFHWPARVRGASLNMGETGDTASRGAITMMEAALLLKC